MATSNSLYNHLLKGLYPPQASSYISVPWNREMHLQWNLFFSNGNNNADLSPQYEYNKASSSSFTDQEEYIALIRSHDFIKSQKRFLPFQAFSSKKTGMAKKKGEKQNTPFRINFGFPFGLNPAMAFLRQIHSANSFAHHPSKWAKNGPSPFVLKENSTPHTKTAHRYRKGNWWSERIFLFGFP